MTAMLLRLWHLSFVASSGVFMCGCHHEITEDILYSEFSWPINPEGLGSWLTFLVSVLLLQCGPLHLHKLPGASLALMTFHCMTGKLISFLSWNCSPQIWDYLFGYPLGAEKWTPLRMAGWKLDCLLPSRGRKRKGAAVYRRIYMVP